MSCPPGLFSGDYLPRVKGGKQQTADSHSLGRRDENVKNVHYILTPKPWELEHNEEVDKGGQGDETDRWWREVDMERRRWEVDNGVSVGGCAGGEDKLGGR